LLPSDSGGFQQELVAQDLPGAKVEKFSLQPNKKLNRILPARKTWSDGDHGYLMPMPDFPGQMPTARSHKQNFSNLKLRVPELSHNA
jgi:hypothetical protein